MLKRLFLLLLLPPWIASGLSAVGRAVVPAVIHGQQVDASRVLVRVADPTTAVAQSAVLSSMGASVVHASRLVPGQFVIEFDGAGAPALAGHAQASAPADHADLLLARIEALRATGLYVYVEPDYIVTPDLDAGDARYMDGTLWGLRNLGFGGGVAGVDIDASRAWDVTTGSASVIVAVIDSGIRYTHADLAAQMWRNPGEIPGNGVDDDGNGYVDDVFGIDAIAGTGNPADSLGHGTHVAGTIGAAANDGNPHVGVAWSVRLMACRFLTDAGGRTSDAITCIEYALDHGARIINASWGGGGRSQALRDAIASAGARGALFVASAGNTANYNDLQPRYPAGYSLPNLISVASIERDGTLSPFSNYGDATVHLAAPGGSILSCLNTSDTAYGAASGTSMAAPHVSGAAVLVAGHFPGISVADLRHRLIRSSRPSDGLAGSVLSGGHLDAYRALTIMPDGQLEVSVAPGNADLVFIGRATRLVAEVTDLLGIEGATVSGRIDQTGVTFELRDDGVAPDEVASDARYSGTFVVPDVSGAIDVVVTATAPGKLSAAQTRAYIVVHPPENDAFAERAVLAGRAASDSTTSMGATAEPGEPTHGGEQAMASLWWTWTATDTTMVTLTTAGSAIDTVLAVYTGQTLASLQPVASNDDATSAVWTSRVEFQAVQGVAYQIAVDAHDGEWGTVELHLHTAVTPSNDDFAAATVLSGAEVEFVGSLYNATLEPGEPVPDGQPWTRSVWWSWTAPAEGTVRIHGLVAGVGVYTGTGVGALAPVTLSPDGGSGGVDVRFSATAGTTYRIAAYGHPVVGSIVDDFSMGLVLRDRPANDLFAQRTVLSGPSAQASGSTEDATLETFEPWSGYVVPAAASVWWTWAAPADGVLLLELQETSSHHIAVYTGGDLPSLVPVVSSLQGWWGPGPRRVTTPVTAGTSYQIAVGGVRGPLAFTLTLLDAPANDAFANRTRIEGADVTLLGNNTGASREPGEPVPTAYGSGRTLWWSWIAPSSGTASIAITQGSGHVAVYTGAQIESLAPVVNTMSSPVSTRHVFHAVEGVEYQIWCDGLFSYMGPLGLSLVVAPGPANDMFADRAVLTGDRISLGASTRRATAETGELQSGRAPRSLWWSWLAPASGPVQITNLPTWGCSLSAYTGDNLASLVPVGEVAGQPGGVNFSAEAGTAYTIRLATEDEVDDVRLVLYQGSRPANDAFASRVQLSGPNVRVTGHNRGATREPTEGSHGSGASGMSVWWTWTAPTDGGVVIDTAGSDFDTHLAVFTGSVLVSLTSVATHGGHFESGVPSRVAFTAQAGVTYQIAVDGLRNETGSIQLNLSHRLTPTNDQFAARRTTSGDRVDIAGYLIGAGREPDEPSFAGASPFASVWYEWMPPFSGLAVITVPGADTATSIGVFSGDALQALIPVENMYRLGMERRFAFAAEHGTAYKIGIGGSRTSADFRLVIRLDPSPENDDFGNATVVESTSFTAVGSTIGATFEAGEPTYATIPPVCSVWWTWIAPESGTYLVSSAGSAAPASLGIYTGNSLDALHRVWEGVGQASGARYLLTATAGVAHRFVLAHTESFNGPVALTIHKGPPPPNDDFGAAAPLAGLDATVHANNRGATSEPGEPSHGGTSAGTSVWWTWTAPLSARMHFTTEGSGFDTVLALYRGDALGQLVPFAANDDASAADRTSSLVVEVEQGATYHIAVAGVGDAMGDIALAVIAGTEPLAVSIEAPVASVVAGTRVELAASAYGTGPLHYQWYHDGVIIAGAEEAILRLPCVQMYQEGSYTVLVRNVFGDLLSTAHAVSVVPPSDSPARLMNLSTRALCLTGDDILIPGFVINGPGAKRMLIRGVGPTLADFGVNGVLPDPRIVLTRDGATHAQNDDWGAGADPAAIAAAAVQVGAFALAEGSADAALLVDLPAGRYTVVTSDSLGATGVAMVELYDVDATSGGARLVNISNRGYVGTGNDIMIPGFVVSEEGPRTFLVRAIGPSLAEFGVAGVLENPRLTIFRKNPETGVVEPILANDDWDGGPHSAATAERAEQVGAFPLVAGSKDAAFVVTLPPGIYTVHASGVGHATGVALVEIYLVP